MLWIFLIFSEPIIANENLWKSLLTINGRCCCWSFLPQGRFFLIDAKFLCHVPFLSALRNQSHSLHLLPSMHPITLFLVFQEFSFLETFLRWPSVIGSRVLRHAQSNFSVFISNFPSRSDFHPPFLISAHLMHAVSRESLHILNTER